MNPSLGRNVEAMDPLEWLARMADHIPDASKHRTRFEAHGGRPRLQARTGGGLEVTCWLPGRPPWAP